MDYFSNLIDSRIAQQTKNQFMKTQPATVINNGSVDQMKVVRLLATGATAELLNMTGVDLSVGDQVQVYSCGKTMYIGASRNIVESTIYTAGDNISISSENVISSYLHATSILRNNIISQGGSPKVGFDYSINVSRPTVWSGWLASINFSALYPSIANETRGLTFFGSGAALKTASYAYIPGFSVESGSDVYSCSNVTAYIYRGGTSSLKLHIAPRYYTVNGGIKNYEPEPVFEAATIVCFN